MDVRSTVRVFPVARVLLGSGGGIHNGFRHSAQWVRGNRVCYHRVWECNPREQGEGQGEWPAKEGPCLHPLLTSGIRFSHQTPGFFCPVRCSPFLPTHFCAASTWEMRGSCCIWTGILLYEVILLVSSCSFFLLSCLSFCYWVLGDLYIFSIQIFSVTHVTTICFPTLAFPDLTAYIYIVFFF